MKHGARIYLSIAFFNSLVMVLVPLLATGSPSASGQASSDRGAAIFSKIVLRQRHSIRPGEIKVGPSLDGVPREGSGTLRMRYGRQLRMAKGRDARAQGEVRPGRDRRFGRILENSIDAASKIVPRQSLDLALVASRAI